MKNNIDSHFHVSISADFNFWATVYSHGWCALKPFMVEKENQSLNRLFELQDGRLVYSRIKLANPLKLRIECQARGELNKTEKNELVEQVKNILRIDDDFRDFYSIAKRDNHFDWVEKIKAGRLLRSPTVFEDIVKLICTTNCSWSLTEVMVENLTSKLGKKILVNNGDGTNTTLFSFPTPNAIAAVDEKFLRSEIRAGYRAPYLLELAKKVANSELVLELWKDDKLSTIDLFKMVKSVKGVGPYAAGNMLKLLGHYDYLAIDSWCRKKFFELYKKGRKVSDKSIEKFYDHYEKWRGLFFWMDVTKNWY